MNDNVNKAITDAKWQAERAWEMFVRQPIGKVSLDPPATILGEIAHDYRTSGHWVVSTDDEYRKAYNEAIMHQNQVLTERADSVRRALSHLVNYLTPKEV